MKAGERYWVLVDRRTNDIMEDPEGNTYRFKSIEETHKFIGEHEITGVEVVCCRW